MSLSRYIPEEEIVVEHQRPTHEIIEQLAYSKAVEPIITFQYNHTHPPGVITDGIDGIDIYQLSGVYELFSGGYESDYVCTTERGVRSLADELFTDRKSVPRWLICGIDTETDLPPWMPDNVEIGRTFECDRCGVEEHVGGATRTDEGRYVCEECCHDIFYK